MRTTARYSDGRTAGARPAELHLADGLLRICDAGGAEIAAWPVAGIRLIGEIDAESGAILRRDGEYDERLLVRDAAFVAALQATQPQLRRDPYGEWRLVRVAAVWLAVATIGIVALFTIAVPALARQLAHAMPARIEIRIGDRIAPAAARLFAPARGLAECRAPAGREALDAMVARLASHANLHVPLRVRVIDSPMPNAFALPGGHVFILRGLFDLAQGPDEVAGVLAHEIAHIELRHPAEVAIKRATGAFLVGLLFGDVLGLSVLGVVADTLISAAYTRPAEADADRRGVEILSAAGVSAAPFAAFFERLAAKDAGMPDILAYLSSHPPSPERAQRARDGAHDGVPILDDGAWQALKTICR